MGEIGVLNYKRKMIENCFVIIFCSILLGSCSKTEQGIDEKSGEYIKSQLESILKENSIEGRIVEYNWLDNLEELAEKYPVLYGGLPNGAYEVKTERFRLMVDVEARKILKIFNEVSVSLG